MVACVSVKDQRRNHPRHRAVLSLTSPKALKAWTIGRHGPQYGTDLPHKVAKGARFLLFHGVYHPVEKTGQKTAGIGADRLRKGRQAAYGTKLRVSQRLRASGQNHTYLALLMTAVILPRWRMIDASFRRRSMSCSSKAATRAGSKSAKALCNAGALLRTTSQPSPV